MRDILFRGKTNKGKWVQGFYVCLNVKSHRIYSGYAETDCGNYYPDCYDVIPETIGQYTGLTDSNGKKIFEGDIIRYADKYDYNCYLESLDNAEAYDDVDFGNILTIDEVVYGVEVGYPAFDLNKHDWEVNGLSNLNESCQYFYEVIGNIHDNPELLKENNNAERIKTLS